MAGIVLLDKPQGLTSTQALQRVRGYSPAAALSLVRLRLAHGQRDEALDAAMMELPPPIVVCRACAREMPRFRFRCDECGAWDSAVILDAQRLDVALRRSEA